MMRLLIASLFFCCMLPTVYAQSTGESFILSVGVSGDVTPPTTPTLLSVTPVTYSQIDVVWGAVTDNIAVGGYQVYRDAIQVATTTLTTFSDTGLMGSTTYSYSVRAFDISRNYSTTSNTIATTTPPAPPPPPEATSTTPSPTRVPLKLELFSIITAPTTARIEWETNRFSQFQLRWGRTTSYELGYVVSDIFSKEHVTTIDNLEPGTRYEYELIGFNQRGDEFVLAKDYFITDPGPDINAPANVANLRALLVEGQVLLSWLNPDDDDFSHVRVLRSHLFYPNDSADGFVVYQGDGEAAVDGNPFVYSERVFYTVFSIDEAGNISSGAIIAVDRYGGVIRVGDIELSELPQEIDRQTEEQTGAIPPLSLADVEFIQHGIVKTADEAGEIDIDGGANLTIRIRYELLPEHLKNITISLQHPTDPELQFSFLLRINKDKSAYEATIAPLRESGSYAVTIHIFDFKTELLHTISGLLNAVYVPTETLQQQLFPYGTWSADRILLLTICLILLLLVVFWFILFRRREREKEQQ